MKTSKISRYVKQIKQRHLSPKQRLRIHYKLGKFIEQGEIVPLSTKAKRGARRTYKYFKGRKHEMNSSLFSARDLATLNESQFQNLMGHSEFSRGNVLDMSLDELMAPLSPDISHDLSYDLGSLRNTSDLTVVEPQPF